MKSDSASATVHNAVLTVSKTDSATNLAITASPATFAIYHYNKISTGWDFIRSENTGSNGSFDLTFAQSPATGSPQLVTGDLYKLVETAAPADYALDETPRYFIWNNNATDGDKKAAALTAATGATVLEGVTTANISFLGVNGDRATMAIPNKQNCLTLRKIWYGIGNDTIEAPVEKIQVQLYRYKDGTNKADAETVCDHEVVDLSEIVRRVFRMLVPLADKTEVRLTANLDRGCFVLSMEDDAYQIIFNLVENGIKYNHSGGCVHVTVSHTQEDVELLVEDTGMGIPQAAIEHIFERFYRVDKARSRQAGGSGLGLSIVHELVERNFGSIAVSSEEGKGTRFTVRLPYFALEEDEDDA